MTYNLHYTHYTNRKKQANYLHRSFLIELWLQFFLIDINSSCDFTAEI